MRFSRTMALALALSSPLSLATAACVGPTFVVQQYSGPARPPESIATLRVNGADAVQLLTLDNEDVAARIATDSRLHIELLPGRHRITLVSLNAPSEVLEPVLFQAEPGKVYRLTVAPGTGGAPGTGAHLWEVDRASDALGREVTPPAPALAPAPAPVFQTPPG